MLYIYALKAILQQLVDQLVCKYRKGERRTNNSYSGKQTGTQAGRGTAGQSQRLSKRMEERNTNVICCAFLVKKSPLTCTDYTDFTHSQTKFSVHCTAILSS
jgi:hypothetical protein